MKLAIATTLTEAAAHAPELLPLVQAQVEHFNKTIAALHTVNARLAELYAWFEGVAGGVATDEDAATSYATLVAHLFERIDLETESKLLAQALLSTAAHLRALNSAIPAEAYECECHKPARDALD